MIRYLFNLLDNLFVHRVQLNTIENSRWTCMSHINQFHRKIKYLSYLINAIQFSHELTQFLLARTLEHRLLGAAKKQLIFAILNTAFKRLLIKFVVILQIRGLWFRLLVGCLMYLDLWMRYNTSKNQQFPSPLD